MIARLRSLKRLRDDRHASGDAVGIQQQVDHPRAACILGKRGERAFEPFGGNILRQNDLAHALRLIVGIVERRGKRLVFGGVGGLLKDHVIHDEFGLIWHEGANELGMKRTLPGEALLQLLFALLVNCDDDDVLQWRAFASQLKAEIVCHQFQ